jgi:hypothetical protein
MALAGPAAAAANGQGKQPVATAQQLFEAGQYEQALKSLGEMRDKGAAGLPEAFLAAHAALKLNQNDRAKEEFARLTAADDKVWKLVGESATAAVDNDRDRALELAVKAVDERAGPAIGPRLWLPTRWLRTEGKEWAGAAGALARAAGNSELRGPRLCRSLLAREAADQVVRYFEMFLKLAPKAPGVPRSRRSSGRSGPLRDDISTRQRGTKCAAGGSSPLRLRASACSSSRHLPFVRTCCRGRPWVGLRIRFEAASSTTAFSP